MAGIIDVRDGGHASAVRRITISLASFRLIPARPSTITLIVKRDEAHCRYVDVQVVWILNRLAERAPLAGWWFVKVRRWLCTALEYAGLHRADCEKCGRFQQCWGEEIRKRLEQLREFERPSHELILPRENKRSNDDAA